MAVMTSVRTPVLAAAFVATAGAVLVIARARVRRRPWPDAINRLMVESEFDSPREQELDS